MYGKELILDLHSCNPSKFNREDIESFFIQLCKLINMKREDLHFWDYYGHPADKARAPAHLKGTTAIQFISTSNITLHTLDDLKTLYLNVFSCKDFHPQIVERYTSDFFSGRLANVTIVNRI